MRETEREGSTKGKGGLYKKLQIPTLPPKWPRSGVTFHFVNWLGQKPDCPPSFLFYGFTAHQMVP